MATQHEIFIDIAQRSACAFTALTQLPSVQLKHLTEEALAFAFFAAGTITPVSGWESGRVVVKQNPTAAVLLLDTELTVSGADETTRYTAAWTAEQMDSVALRAFLGSATSPQDCWCEIEWTASGETQRVAFPISIQPAFSFPEDSIPDPAEPSSAAWLKSQAVMFSESQTLNPEQAMQAINNLLITLGSDGVLRFPSGHYIVLNSPPA